jgi:hypothetical protein
LKKSTIPLRPKGVKRTVLTKALLEEFYIKKKCSVYKLAQEFGCGRTSVFRHLKKYGLKRRDLSDAHITYKKHSFSGDFIEKAYLIGFAIGDLRVRKVGKASKIIKVDCGSTKLAQISLIENLFKSMVIFGKVDYIRIIKCTSKFFLMTHFHFY